MSDNETVSPYEAYNLMVNDYQDTQSGVLPPSAETLSVEPDQKEHLQQLRANLGYYGLEIAGVAPEQIAHDVGLSSDLLIEELSHDERLIERTATLRDRLHSPKVQGIEEFLTEPLSTKVINWLSPESEGLRLQTEPVESEGLKFEFVDLSPLHRVTAKAEANVEKEGHLEEALEHIKKIDIPRLEEAIKSGKGSDFRPVQDIGSNNRDRVVKTDYPAYKFGLNGTEHRAILLLMGTKEGRRIYGLAAIYNHTEQDAVFSALSQGKTKR